jgi:ketosteroid isomerase-like protein
VTSTFLLEESTMRAIQSAAIVRAVLDAVDSRDLDALDSCIADDVHFRFGNAEPTNTKAEFAAAMHPFLRGIGGIRHDVIEMWEVPDGGVIATTEVHYTRLDRHQLVLPCCNVFRVRDGLVCDYRIYMDVNPVTAANYPPPIPKPASAF